VSENDSIFSNGDKWKLFILAAILGSAGGAGFRVIDPTKYTSERGDKLEGKVEEHIENHPHDVFAQRILMKLDEQTQIINKHLQQHPDRDLDRRLLRIEILLESISNEHSEMRHHFRIREQQTESFKQQRKNSYGP
jgi:hypothetical protein